MGLLRFVLHFSFLIAIASSGYYFSLLNFGVNDQLKYCFLVVTIFTSTSSIGFSMYLLNIALLLNLAF